MFTKTKNINKIFLSQLIALFCLGCYTSEQSVYVSRQDQQPPAPQQSDVNISNKGAYYQVSINFEGGATHRQIGRQYARKIRQIIPDFEPLADSYIAELTHNDKNAHKAFLKRIADIKPQLPLEHREELEGLAGEFACMQNVPGDGKLSPDEIYLLNLIPDIARQTQCAAFSVFGIRSGNQRTVTARILDWPGGSQHQISKIQAVTIIRNFDKSVCLVGYVGFLGAITAVNDNKIFAAILDSPTGAPFTSAGRHSYPFDLRHGLENLASIREVAQYMADPARQYTVNHLIFLSDPDESKVLENNLSGPGSHVRRALRSDSSPLNSGIVWDLPNAIAAVNGFLLNGNTDNFSGNPGNVERWKSINTLLHQAEDHVTATDLMRMAGFQAKTKTKEKGNLTHTPADLYGNNTQQIVIYNSEKTALDIFFRPKNGALPPTPTFQEVPIIF